MRKGELLTYANTAVLQDSRIVELRRRQDALAVSYTHLTLPTSDLV